MDRKLSGGKHLLVDRALGCFAGTSTVLRECLCGYFLLILVLGLAGAGCVPLRFTTSPGATGRIVDSTTHEPIDGAEVVVSRSTYPPSSADGAFTNSRPPTVMSNDRGQFSVPFERRLDLYFLPVDAFPRFGLLVVRHQGYETACVPFWSRSMAQLGEVRLKSAAK